MTAWAQDCAQNVPTDTVDIVDGLNDAYSRCPRCLVRLDDDGPDELPHLVCPVCGDVWL